MKKIYKPIYSIYDFLFLIFFVLAIVHVPLITIEGDAIGLFDVVCVIYFFIGLIAVALNKKIYIQKKDFPIVAIVLIFLLYIFGVTIYANISKGINFFSLALLFKQYQFLIIFLISIFFWKRISLFKAHRYIYLLIGIAFAYGFYKILIVNQWLRLGLILKEPVAPNPAGFILAIALLSLFFISFDKIYRKKISKFILIIFFLIGYLSLLLTFSRTNNIAFILTAIVFALFRFKEKTVNFIFVLLVFIALSFILPALLEIKIYKNKLPIEYILNPDLIFSDTSFGARIERVWFYGFEQWRQNFLTIFFGIGLGFVRKTDGLYTYLLFTTGILGSLMYYLSLVFLSLRYGLYIKMMVVYILLNGIGTETTILSYRSMQVFLIFLAFFIVYHREHKTDFVNPYVKNIKVL